MFVVERIDDEIKYVFFLSPNFVVCCLKMESSSSLRRQPLVYFCLHFSVIKMKALLRYLDPVVQSIVSLTESLVVKMLTVLASTISNS